MTLWGSAWPLLAFLLGLVVGSFLNVVIHRLPKGESVVFPPSHCPSCGHRLGPKDLVPILSYLTLKGRCRYCQSPIPVRYPLVEALTGGSFFLVALALPPSFFALFAFLFFSFLIALASIDLDTYELPDALTYGLLFLGLVLKGREGLDGALLSAGLLALVAGYGGLILRRGKDAPPDYPVGTHQVHLSALVGAIFGGGIGMAAGFLNWALNARLGRPLALPDPLSFGLFPLALLLRPDPLQALLDALLAAGGVALAGGLYWAVRGWLPSAERETAESEPVAMGYGDVKLLGALGAWVGFGGALLSLFLAALLGALMGLFLRQRKIPFGPYLALGGGIAFLYGDALIRAYLNWVGL